MQLQEGCAALGLDLPRQCSRGCLGYLALLKKWNRTYNLTAIRDEERNGDPASA